MRDERWDVAHSGEAAGAVGNLYQQVLGRSLDAANSADAASLSSYENRLGGTSTLSDVRSDLAHSGEASSALDSLYVQILGRGVDSTALTNRENAMGAGWALRDERWDIAQSGEAATAIGAAWLRATGATAGLPDLSYWQGRLGGDASLDTLRQTLAYAYQPTVDAINAAWRGASGASAGLDDLNYWRGQIASGSSLDALRQALAYAYQPTVDAINAAWQAATGTGVDPSSLATWRGLFASGQGLSDLRYALANGPTQASQYLQLVQSRNNAAPNEFNPGGSLTPGIPLIAIPGISDSTIASILDAAHLAYARV